MTRESPAARLHSKSPSPLLLNGFRLRPGMEAGGQIRARVRDCSRAPWLHPDQLTAPADRSRNDLSTPESCRTPALCGFLARAAQSCRPSSRWKESAWPPHGNSIRVKFLFQASERGQLIMKNRSREGCVGTAVAKYFYEMLRTPCTSGSDHRNPHGACHSSRQLAVKS